MLRDRKNNVFPTDYAQKVGEVFIRIDACLADALHCLDPVTHLSAFASRMADGVPVQHQMLLDGLDQVRSAMRTIVERHGIALPAPAGSAVDTCRLRISEAILAVSELDPRNWRHPLRSSASGLPDDLEEDASRLVAHLMALLESMHASLAEDTTSRQSSVQESADPCLVSELERMTATHGLGDLHRRAIGFARHHATGDVVIGFFGSVSAGKSSLINSLLGSALLPVAALPTTTVPVEIHHGRVAKGTVEFVAAKPELIEPGRIAEFVDDHYNNANARRVTRIVLEAPAALLAGGITLIDTPGINWTVSNAMPGSLMAAPWCDLAIVLVSATAPLTLREAALVRQLSGHGVRVALLITKIDCVEADDRWRIYDHVVRGLWKSTRLDVPVYLMSTSEEDPPWRRAWVDGPLADTIAQCREQRAAMRARQLAALRCDVLDALRIRLLWRSPSALDDEQVNEISAALCSLRDAVQAALPPPGDCAALLDQIMASLTKEIAHNAAALWSETHDTVFDATRLVELAVNARTFSVAGNATRTLETLYARADIALHHAANAPGTACRLPTPSPAASIAPAFAFDQPLPSTLLPRSLGWVMGRWGFYLSARNNLLHSASMGVVRQSLSFWLERLNAWMRRELAALSSELHERTTLIRAAQTRANPGTDELRRDIDRLRSAKPG